MVLTQDIINRMAEITGGTKKDAKLHFDAFKQANVEALEAGEDIAIKGFYTVENKLVEAHKAKNPKTQEEVDVPAHRKATMKLAKGLRKF